MNVTEATKELQEEILVLLQKPQFAQLPTFAVLGVLSFTQTLISTSAINSD